MNDMHDKDRSCIADHQASLHTLVITGTWPDMDSIVPSCKKGVCCRLPRLLLLTEARATSCCRCCSTWLHRTAALHQSPSTAESDATLGHARQPRRSSSASSRERRPCSPGIMSIPHPPPSGNFPISFLLTYPLPSECVQETDHPSQSPWLKLRPVLPA